MSPQTIAILAGLGLVAWFVIGLAVGLLIGGAVRLREAADRPTFDQ